MDRGGEIFQTTVLDTLNGFCKQAVRLLPNLLPRP